VTLANASIRTRGNADLRKARVQDIQPQAGLTPLLTPTGNGFGRRSLWPLPPVGEAQRRDPHIGDAVPNPPHANSSQANASPPVARVGGFNAGGGVAANGFPAAATYLKLIGRAVTKTLSRAYLAGVVDATWRLGGVSMPFDNWGMGYGLGYQGDAQSVWVDNPQVYLRNPGIKPLTSVPATYRYVTLIGSAPVGPSIGDFGNLPTPGTANQ
jgi:hypothetical protein